MSFKLISYLKENGFKSYKPRTKLEHEIVQFVYILKGSKKIYIHSSYNPNYYLKRYNTWTGRGTSKHLPLPVSKALGFETTESPNKEIRLYYIAGKLDPKVKETLEKEVTTLTNKVTFRPTTVNVAVIRVPKDPKFYRVIKYSGNKNKVAALYEFHTRSSDLADYKGPVNNVPYFEWCRRNKNAIVNKEYIVEDIAIEVEPLVGMLKLAEYALSTTDLRLNQYMPTF